MTNEIASPPVRNDGKITDNRQLKQAVAMERTGKRGFWNILLAIEIGYRYNPALIITNKRRF